MYSGAQTTRTRRVKDVRYEQIDRHMPHLASGLTNSGRSGTRRGKLYKGSYRNGLSMRGGLLLDGPWGCRVRGRRIQGSGLKNIPKPRVQIAPTDTYGMVFEPTYPQTQAQRFQLDPQSGEQDRFIAILQGGTTDVPRSQVRLRSWMLGLGFRVLGFRVLGFRGLGV